VSSDRDLLFHTLDAEVGDVALPVRGRLPAWLTGTLIRNGPARFEYPSQPLRHWFDGHAMLHRFAFARGTVRYANRFVRSRAADAARARGRLAYREFATDPCMTAFRRARALFTSDVSDNASVHVASLGGQAFAMSEGALPIAFDPGTLETLGPFVFGERHALRRAITTAHPHADAAGAGLVNYLTRFGVRTRYEVFTVDAATRRRDVLAAIPAPEPAYMHSFGLTATRVVLAEFPLTIHLGALLRSGLPFIDNYRWRPERGTRWLLVGRGGDAAPVACEGEPFFAFHHVNAFDDGGDVVADVIGYDDAAIVAALSLDRLRDPDARFPAGQFRRYRLSPPRGGRSAGTAREVARDAASLELPRIHYARHNARPYRYCYAGAAPHPGGFLSALAKLDVEGGARLGWSAPRCYAGEPVFVPAPDARAEDDGVVLSVVLDGAAGRSFLLVLDARSFEEVARAEAPHAIPAGFHGAML
jgi:carotenoid cleavage dioxygenase-like enzyme